MGELAEAAAPLPGVALRSNREGPQADRTETRLVGPVRDGAAQESAALHVAERDSIERERLRRGLSRLRSLALLMDDRFELPIVRVRIGLDPLIGLIPAWGDWITWAVSSFILLEAIRLGVPLRKLLVMALHVAVDLVTGYVPGIGDLIDIAYKANRRNVNIVLEHFGAQPITFAKSLPASQPQAPSQTLPNGAQPAQSAAAPPQLVRDSEAAAEPIIELPADALDRRTSSLSRWLVGTSLLLLLAALAAAPFFFIWQLIAGG